MWFGLGVSWRSEARLALWTAPADTADLPLSSLFLRAPGSFCPRFGACGLGSLFIRASTAGCVLFSLASGPPCWQGAGGDKPRAAASPSPPWFLCGDLKTPCFLGGMGWLRWMRCWRCCAARASCLALWRGGALRNASVTTGWCASATTAPGLANDACKASQRRRWCTSATVECFWCLVMSTFLMCAKYTRSLTLGCSSTLCIACGA